MQTVFIAAMSSITPHTPDRAIAFVAVAAFFVGGQQVISLLVVQLGTEDRNIGVATGYVLPIAHCYTFHISRH